MDVTIRTAVQDDAEAIATSHIASWRSAYAHIFPASVFADDEFDRSRYDRWRSWPLSLTPDRRLVVATIDGAVIGFAQTGPTDEPDIDDAERCGELFGFYTHPDTWGTGAAGALMSAALEHLASLGHERAVVWTLADAHRARAFYAKTGWTLTGRTGTWSFYAEHPVAEVEYEYTFS